MRVLEYIDFILLALALPLFLVAGFPIEGWAAGAGVYTVQRLLQAFLVRKAKATDDTRARVGYLAGGLVGRGWLVALTIFGVGLGVSDEAGLSAALLFLAVFTVHFTFSLIPRPTPGQMTTSDDTKKEKSGLGTGLKVAIIAGLLVALAGALFAIVGSEGKNDSYKPQNEFKLDPWIELKLGPIDMSINKAVMYLIIGCVLTCFVMTYIAKRMTDKPNRVQTAIEALYDLTRTNITKGNMDDRMAAKWFGVVATLFFFIWISNLIGYIPLPTNTEHKVDVFGLEVPALALYAATANISVPLVLTLMIWVAYHVEGIRAKGFVPYFKSWIPAGVEGPARYPIFVIEAISHFVRIISLSVRLFANILAGHLLILFMGGGLVVLLGAAWAGVLTVPMAVAFFIFEVGLVATLQAFIFATLTSIYLGGAVAESH